MYSTFHRFMFCMKLCSDFNQQVDKKLEMKPNRFNFRFSTKLLMNGIEEIKRRSFPISDGFCGFSNISYSASESVVNLLETDVIRIFLFISPMCQ